MAKSPKAPTYKCHFCDKEFKREDTILTHKCMKRDRYNDRDSRQMREAFRIYMQFMTFNHLSMKKAVEPLMHFIKSRYFNDFFELAEYVLQNDILNKEDFITNIITTGKPVYEWRTHKTLEEWVQKCVRDEHPRRAVERSIPALIEWSEITGHEWNTFFENVSTERAILWLETGKISPWLIYIASPDSGNKLLQRFSDSELEYAFKFIDPTYFQMKQIRYQNDCNQIRELLTEAGL